MNEEKQLRKQFPTPEERQAYMAADQSLEAQMPSKAFPYVCDKCGKAWKSKPALNMHYIRKHTKGWQTGSNFKGARGGKKKRFPSDDPEYRRMKARERYRSMPIAERRRVWRQNSQRQRDRVKALEALANGAKREDQIGDAAKAILLAARVLKATLTGLKLP